MTLLTEESRSDSLLDCSVTQVARDVMVDSSPELLIPKELSPFKVKKVLGEGGMGVVHLAEREDLKSLSRSKFCGTPGCLPRAATVLPRSSELWLN